MDLFRELKIYWRERENFLFKELPLIKDAPQKITLTAFYYNAKFMSQMLVEREALLSWVDWPFYADRVKTIEKFFIK